MSSHGHMACVLEVNPHCDACMRHTIEVIYSVDGVYDVEYDAQTKTARIVGEVDPNECLEALARCGYHAAVKHVKLTHPRISTMGSYDPFGSYNHTYPRFDHYAPHSLGYGGGPYRRSLPQGMWHDYPARRVVPYSYNTVPHHYGGPTPYYDRPYARDSYRDYNTYGYCGMDMCNII